MAHNLKAGIVATTTMVGSALAYSRSQVREDGQRTTTMVGLSSTTSGGGGQHQSHPGAQKDQHQTGNNKYQETVNQMMHWKY